MAQQCERPGCAQPAAVEYIIDPQSLLLTLQNYEVVKGERRSALCAVHGDRMSVPKGWSIDDRREDPPRLFRTPKSGVAPAKASVKKSATESKQKKKPAVRPMLFQAEKKVVEEVQEVQTPATKPVVRDADLQETKALPWTPQFDRTDDLGGVLRPKGKLLSRAFGLDETIEYPRPVVDDVVDNVPAVELERETFNEFDIP
ncbi:MAG: DUF3499 family protein [Ilumatobacteraceae bacterium]|uniref:DUF3499 family protein n=1 Tax=Acidimicrobiia bacterium BACL6 MAG-120924-bin43 TaxID=1655583 RepID=A0A0R2QET6_9ACTN|nr:MAG: hypothetical protein ABR75_06225 [Acidimicrobiia bacterium BACL6 MAG-120924-bin43]KRO53089.1 MAG: hypothetical protein ABR78_09050 [Acidimicrobiia bacterium BACL6 MAG-120910-bin40]KRO57669.1 MAG: hypothetical protein ABR77_09140 [Acidimicrobiia bacterium BACL6 MAG-120322-bin79]HAG67608.1 hypothetical protein [Acidimicrobium sp.]